MKDRRYYGTCSRVKRLRLKAPSRTDYDQSVRVIDERPTSGTITQQEDTETGYKSVRDLE
jgi:hypothetical protein